MGLVDVLVLSYVDGHVPRLVEDVSWLRLGQGDVRELAVLALRVMADGDPGLPVAVLGESAAVQAPAGSRTAPYVWDAELAVSGRHDSVRVRPRALEVLDRHGVEPSQAVGVHHGLEALDIGRARGPARILQALRHEVRVMLLHGLADGCVVRIRFGLKEDPAPELDAVDVGLEHREVRGDRRVDAGRVLLAGHPGALPCDLGAAREAPRPLHAEEVVVSRRKPAHGVALAALHDDLREGAAGGMPVLLLAFERGLDHLVGDVGRQAI